MNTELLPISKITRADYNPRTMPDAEMQALMLSIKTFGFVEPVVVNKRMASVFGFPIAVGGPQKPDEAKLLFTYVLIGGHQRLTAVEKLLEAKGGLGARPKGIEIDPMTPEHVHAWTVPCIILELDLEHEKALNLALNKISGSWDTSKLGEIIVALKDSTVLPATGFSAAEVAGILASMQPKAPEAPADGEIAVCERCKQVRQELEGHERRSGHTVQEKTEE